MKQSIITVILITIAGFTAFSQSKATALDKSPMDMSYYPVNYPILKIQDKLTEPLIVRVTYGRPQRNGRPIFGELVEYGKVWRLGANEATEIEFFKDVAVAGKPVPKGRYTLYTIPHPDKWIFIVNSETDTWGSFKYDSKKDLVRIEVPVQKSDEPVEFFSLYFDKSATGFDLFALWENTAVTIPMQLRQQSKTPPKAAKKKIP